VNKNRRMVFSAQSVPMTVHATMKYFMPLLSNCYRGDVFSARSMPQCYNQDQLAAVRELLCFSHCELLLLEAGTEVRGS
jgi:hypothetical protein